jgi:hypothetical protein
LTLLPGMVPELAPIPTATPDTMPDVWLWTARYQNRNIAHYELAAVRITLGHPRFRLGYALAATMMELAPPREALDAPPAELETACRAKMQTHGIETIVARLRSLHETTSRPLVLCCFEDLRKPGEWCHRTTLATVLAEHGLPVVELAEG